MLPQECTQNSSIDSSYIPRTSRDVSIVAYNFNLHTAESRLLNCLFPKKCLFSIRNFLSEETCDQN